MRIRTIWDQNGLMLNVALWQKNAQDIHFKWNWFQQRLEQPNFVPTTILKKQNNFERLNSILESPSKPRIKYWILQPFKLWHFQEFCQRKMTLNKNSSPSITTLKMVEIYIPSTWRLKIERKEDLIWFLKSMLTKY